MSWQHPRVKRGVAMGTKEKVESRIREEEEALGKL